MNAAMPSANSASRAEFSVTMASAEARNTLAKIWLRISDASRASGAML